MRARFTFDGKIIIELETPIEGYAFRCWAEENLKPAKDAGAPVKMEMDYIGPVREDDD